MIQHVIGIDPGRHTGFAVYSRAERRLTRVEEKDFWAAYEAALEFDPKTTKVVIEVNAKAPLYAARQQKAAGRIAVAAAIAKNVGQVNHEGTLLAEGLRRKGFTVIESGPLGKKNAEEFKRLTGWEGQTNEHKRDAAVLCWQM